MLNREVDVQDASDSRENRMIKIAQHALGLYLGRSIGVKIAGVKKMSLAMSRRNRRRWLGNPSYEDKVSAKVNSGGSNWL